MAEETKPAAKAAKAPTSADIERARESCASRFLHEGEDPQDARRRDPEGALDLALAELEEASRRPRSVAAPVLAAARPRTRALRGGAPAGRRDSSPPTRSTPCPARSPRCWPRPRSRLQRPRRRRRTGRPPPARPTRTRDLGRRTTTRTRSRPPPRRTTRRTTSRGPRPEEPQDWVEEGEDEEELGEVPDDPNADKRFWFEHATGAGKTVAARGVRGGLGTGGVLILTHRRNLVDQFNGESRDRGYADRLSPALLDGAGPPLRAGDRRDLPVVRPQRRPDLRRVLDRDLRRGAHRPGREDQRLHPRLGRAPSSSA